MVRIAPDKFPISAPKNEFTPSPFAGCVAYPTDEKFGVFNFTGFMLVGYRAYCFANNLDVNDVGVQTDYLLKMLEEKTKLRGTEVKSAETIEKAEQLIHEYILQDTTNIDKTIDLAYDFLERNTA